MSCMWFGWKITLIILVVVSSLRQYGLCISQQIEESFPKTPNSDFPEEEAEQDRKARLSLFKLVKFENYNCNALNGFTGTCLLEKECRNLGGNPQGSCALSFGVCCYFESGCGSTTSVNNSYFVGPSTLGTGIGNCQYTINKAAPNVCQIRLDFEDFNLAQPNQAGECAHDKMNIIGNNLGVPTICGSNVGQHVYLHTGPANSPVTVSVSAARDFPGRRWRIRSTQIPCNSMSSAPSGCLQYFTGVTGMIKSFNFLPNNKGFHLNNQLYSICVRPEYRFCSICYTQCGSSASGSFSISANQHDGDDARLTSQNNDLCPNDYLMIPCAQTDQVALGPCEVNSLCGGALNTEDLEDATTVCSFVRPFRLMFKTDANEAIAFDEDGPDVNSAGFCLNYVQNPC